MKILATGFKGLENVHAEEIKEKINTRILEAKEGKIIFECNENEVYKALLSLLTINRLYLILIEKETKLLEEIYKEVSSFDFSFLINENQTFAVRSVRKGEHKFTSIDINKIVGKAIIDSYFKSTNKKLKVNLKNPNLIFKAYLIDNSFRLTLNITGKSLHKRGYRAVKHPAPLKPTLAACLVRIANVKNGEKIFDPFCGTGTLLFESYFKITNFNPNFFREFAIQKTKIFDKNKFENARKKLLLKVRECNSCIFGSDINKHYIKGVKKARNKLKANCIFPFVCDALRICFKKIDVDKIISNPPYGIRLFRGKSGKIAEKFLQNVKSTNFKKVLIIPSRKWRERIEKNFSVEKIMKIHYGKFTNFIIVFR